MEPYWQSDDGRHTVYCGDALTVLPTLSRVDTVLTDPPYGINGGGLVLALYEGREIIPLRFVTLLIIFVM